VRLLLRNRPYKPPLIFFLNPLLEWFEDRHIELMRQGAFPEARRAFNPVFVHLPAEGCRLTELAKRANMTKQAMAELVEELVELGYLVRFSDPEDGRAKIILRGKKGLEAHKTTLRAFAQIDRELAELVGGDALEELRKRLAVAKQATASDAR
jgi:DNA-binding MarR family transcriptional regulator